MKAFIKVSIWVSMLLVIMVPRPGFALENHLSLAANPSFDKPAASVPDDLYWDSRFTTRGLSGQVNAIAVNGSNVFVGGNFATADTMVVNRIARWSGGSWSALGEGVGCGISYCTPSVNAIAISGSNIYVGGMFTTAGGVPASSIAVWNGSNWSPLGSGVDGTVSAIAVSGNDVYVGGYFTNAGGVIAHSIAKWNALTNIWSGLGTGGGVFGGSCCLGGGYRSVTAIAVNGSDIYVGGYFNSAGGIDVNYIAKFDGASWSPLGDGVSGNDPHNIPHISAITTGAGNVYVGGAFATAGGVSTNNIAIWDGSNWYPLGNGVSDSYCGRVDVTTIVVGGSIVYVGGSIYLGGSYGIASWDGSNWNGLGSGVTRDTYCSFVNATALSGSELYVGGLFNYAGSYPANNIAKWSGGSWMAVGSSAENSTAGSINAIAVSGNNVYVGGCFSRAGNGAATNIAKWNAVTNTWSPLGPGVSDCVSAIAIIGNDVYVGGSLYWAGGNPVNGIAKWNGSTWSGVGNGVYYGSSWGDIQALATNGADVYVAGKFDKAGLTSANNIAKWDGNAWSALGSGINGSLNAVAVNGNNVYVGGNFATAGGVAARGVARWDGVAWSPMGTCGIDCPFAWTSVNAIATSSNNVYVGGSFSSARAPQKSSPIARSPSGVSASNIARWNLLTNTWYALGSGVDNSVTSLALSGGNLYVGGYFISAGSVDANYIAKWDGSTWSSLGSGLNDYANAIEIYGGSVFVGGNFTTAGAKPSYHFARWNNLTNHFYLPLIRR